MVALSGADHWTLADGSKHPTGFWAEQLVAAHRTFRSSGHAVAVATPGGVTPTVDQISLAPAAVGGVRNAYDLTSYLANLSRVLQVPLVLEEQRPADVDVLFVAGGHGAMEDLADSHALGRLAVAVLESGGIVVAVSHGVAGLVTGERADGRPLVEGVEVTAFSNAEERLGGLADMAPWLLESRLRELGARLLVGAPWTPHVVVSGRLVTGQNPQSSQACARAALVLLDGPGY
jgi:putative intracellular protease/amidase